MRIGVMSDIHSNVVAFKAATNRLESLGCDEYFLLGDYVSDTPYARETMDFLYEFIATHKCHVLRGNREEYMLNQRRAIREGRSDELWTNNSASGNLLFTYQQLTERDLDFFESLPITFTFNREGYPAITCCHGSPSNSRELLFLDGENTREWLHKIPTDYMVCGHTHGPGSVSLDSRYYFNSGCVGIAIGDVGNAQCMIIDDYIENNIHGWRATNLSVPYDYELVVSDIYKTGLIECAPWFINHNIHIMLTGEDYTIELVDLANSLSEEAGVPHVWPNIEECFFEEATRRLGIPDYRGRI